MGCDIHGIFEVKLNGKWYTYDRVKQGRNYWLFGKLAGVRGGGSIFEPKGIPDDISEVTSKELEDWDCDSHTHTWFTKDEMQAILEDVKRESNGLEDIFNYQILWQFFVFEEEVQKYEDGRCLIWFDS